MWFLISESNPDAKYTILGGKVYIVGRRDCDILVTGDSSVSRKHSEISVSHSEVNLSNPTRLPILRLKDVSKFGTWVNKEKVEGDRLLKDGDVIHFGSPCSSFLVVYEPLVVTSSCLETAGKKSVRQTLCTLGGHMVSEWKSDCSLLIMNKISVTVKVICAMVSLKPIVTPAYLETYLEHLQGKKEKPDSDRYIPELAETQVDPSEVSFKSDNRRRSIFEGKTFVFMSEKQLKKMQMAIELAGGLPMLLEGKVDRGLILEAGTVVMNCPDADITKDNQALVAKVTTLLQKNGKHLISDSEIGYAVLYCSTEKHCNPDHAPEGSFSGLPSQTLSQVDPLAVNTQTQASGSVHTQKTKPPGQEAANKNQTASTKITSGGEDTEKVTVKEEPLSGKPTSQTKSNKRGRADEEDDIETPMMSKKIKQEPVTPQQRNQSDKSTNRKPSPEPVKPQYKQNQSLKPANRKLSPEPPSRQTKQDQSKQSTSKKQTPEPVWDSDDDIDFSKIDTNISTNVTNLSTSNINSPDKASSNTSQRNTQKSSKPTVLSDDDEPFHPKTRSRSPAKSKNNIEKIREANTRSPVIETRSRSRSPAKPDNNSRSSERTRNRSPVDNASTEPSKNAASVSGVKSGAKSRSRSNSRSPHRIKEEPDEEMSEVIPRSRSRLSPSRNAERSRKDTTNVENTDIQNTVKMEESDEEVPDVKSAILSADVPAGYLTTHKPIERQVRRNKDYEEDAELPKACIQVEFTSLLARKPQPIRDKDTTTCPEGYSKWKGKIVKNYKKFRKSQHAGSQGLPNIIGGSDLEVHQGQRSKEMDDWFKEALQAESQTATEDRRANDLFDYNPTAKRRGR